MGVVDGTLLAMLEVPFNGNGWQISDRFLQQSTRNQPGQIMLLDNLLELIDTTLNDNCLCRVNQLRRLRKCTNAHAKS